MSEVRGDYLGHSVQYGHFFEILHGELFLSAVGYFFLGSPNLCT